MNERKCGVCPACLKAETDKLEELEKQLKKGYGELSQDEYYELVLKRDAYRYRREVVIEYKNLDYTVDAWMDSKGIFHLLVEASCTKCKWTKSKSQEIDLLVD